MAFLRAYIDDSGSETGDRRLFFAGLLHRAEEWALFAEAWDKALKEPPTIEYLKTSEAQSRRGQFRGWDHEETEAKLLKLARVIRECRPISFQFSIDRSKFDAIYKDAAPYGLGSAHFSCYFGIISGITRYAASIGDNTPVEFIFDEQDGVSIDVALWFDAMKEALPKKVQRLIAGSPIFRDDRQMIQLQAADMLAWYLRREHEGREGDNFETVLDLLRRPREHLFLGEINEDLMARWAEHHRSLPAIDQLRTKSQWKKFRLEMASLLSRGFVPPRGKRWKNAIHKARQRIARFIDL